VPGPRKAVSCHRTPKAILADRYKIKAAAPLRALVLLLALCLLVVGAVFLLNRQTQQPTADAPEVEPFFSTQAKPTPVSLPPFNPQPEPPQLDDATPATLQVHVLLKDKDGDIHPTQLTWPLEDSRNGSFTIPAGGIASPTFPPDIYRFRLLSDKYMCFDERNLQLDAGEVRAATFTVIEGATLEVAIKANVSGITPSGAKLTWGPENSPYNRDLLKYYSAQTQFTDTSGNLIMGPLQPNARYHLVADATGFLAQERFIIASEIPATTFRLNIGGVIAGTVYEEENSVPVAGLGLQLWGGQNAKPSIAITGDDGAFSFVGVWPGEYKIEVGKSAPGVLSSKSTPMPISLNLAEKREDIVLYLGTGGSITVLLIDGTTGEPATAQTFLGASATAESSAFDYLRQINVTLNGNEGVIDNTGGSYKFAGLADGEYEITLDGGKLISNQVHYAVIKDSSDVVVKIPVLPGNFIAGRVVDSKGSPVAHAQMWETSTLHIPGKTRMSGTYFTKNRTISVTSATGYFFIPDLKLGYYAIIATASDQAPGMIDNVPTGTLDAEIKMPRGGRLKLEVYGRDGSPLSTKVKVVHAPALNPISLFDQSVYTDNRGRAVLEHLPTGIYSVEMKKQTTGETEGRAKQLKRITLRRAVNIREAKTTTVVFGGGVGISGRVEVDGEAAPGLTVAHPAMWISHHDLAQGISDELTITDENGEYKLVGLPPGKREWISVSNGSSRITYCEQVQFPRSGTRTVDFNIKTGSISGRVVDLYGVSQSGKRVHVLPRPPGTVATKDSLSAAELLSMAARGRSAKTSGDGSFTITKLPPGDYNVGVGRKENLSCVTPITIKKTGSDEEVQLVLKEAGQLTGRLIGPRPPDKFAMLLMRNSVGGMNVSPMVISGETYKVDKIPPGEYEAMVVSPLRGALSAPERSVQIKIKSEETTYKDFQLSSGKLLIISVFDADDGTPLTGFKARIMKGGHAVRNREISGLLNTWAGLLQPGMYKIHITHPDYMRGRLEVEITTERSTSYKHVELTPKTP
jgi:hypothetical protein